MNPDEMSRTVNEVVARVMRRLEDSSHGDLPSPADERLFGERLTRLKQASEQGAVRFSPQALPLEQCAGVASMIELTLLRPDARESEIVEACRTAVEREYAAVVVLIDWVETAASILSGSDVRLCVPVGFPTGGLATTAKQAEIRSAIGGGADEVDVVMHLDRLRAADYEPAGNDLWKCVDAAGGKPVKAVIEAATLNCEEKAAAAIIAKTCGATFLKTSSGFGPDGVTVGDLAQLRAALDGRPTPAEKPEFAARVGAVTTLRI